MKKFILSLIILMTITLSSCSEGKLIKVEQNEYIITNVDPPKRVYIDLKRVSDGEVFKRVYLKKRMNNWKNIVVGDTLKLNRYTHLNGTMKHTHFEKTEIIKELTIKYNL